MEELSPLDYLSLLKRRRNIFLAVAGAVFVLALIFTASWSNYRSVATIEITQSEIPESMATPTGMEAKDLLQSLADLRISRLRQRVLATGSLVEVITKFNLYPEARQRRPIAEVAEKMRRKIGLQLLSSSLANPAAAQKVSAEQLSAIAFTLSFDYETAPLAQQVTNELVSRFLDEDLKERRNQAKETAIFLETQIKLIEQSLKDQEKRIADFRAEHGDMRPEALAFNQQAAANTQVSLQNIEAQIEANLGNQGNLRGQLAGVDPYSRVLAEGQLLTTPTIQLKTLRSNYAALTAKYGPQHPDVLKAKRQIESLESQTESADPETSALQATLADVRARLETAEKTYGPKNPEVLSLRGQVTKLDAQLAKANMSGPTARESIKKDADNPAYLQIVAQINALGEQHKSLIKQKAALQGQQVKYQKAVLANPAVEQKLAELARDYENEQLRYRDLKAKKLAADMVASIEEDHTGRRLVVIDPPEIPTGTQPSRKLFLLGGLILSFGVGFAVVLGLQLLAQTIVGPRHLGALVGVAPLAIIPHLTTQAERESRKGKRFRLIGLGALGFVLLLIVFSYAVMPLDVLWSVLTRKAGL